MVATVKKYTQMNTERKLSQNLIKNKDHFPPQTYKALVSAYTKLPQLYGLPKIHKDGFPQRPIASCQDSVCHLLCRFLVNIIDPLTVKLPSYVGKSTHIVKIIKDSPIQSNKMDVVSLFIIIEEALSVVMDRLASGSTRKERSSIPINSLIEMLSFFT